MAHLNSVVQIENNPDLVRDLTSKAVVSIDAIGLGRYKEQRRKNIAVKQDSIETKKRLETIEGEMAALKQIICELAAMRSKS